MDKKQNQKGRKQKRGKTRILYKMEMYRQKKKRISEEHNKENTRRLPEKRTSNRKKVFVQRKRSFSGK